MYKVCEKGLTVMIEEVTNKKLGFSEENKLCEETQ